MFGFKVAALAAAVLLAITGAFYWYYQDTQERMGDLRANAAEYKAAAKANEETVIFLQDESRKQEERMSKLQSELKESEKNGDELRAMLRRHDLTSLAKRKPGLIEKRINDASSKLFDDITSDTSD